MMRVLLFLIAFGNLGYLAFHLLSREAKVTSKPDSPLSNPSDDDLTPVETVTEPEPREAIALPEGFDTPQFSETTDTPIPSPTIPSPSATADRTPPPQISQISPVEVPSHLAISLPEFSLGFPITEISPSPERNFRLEQNGREIIDPSRRLSARSRTGITVPNLRDLPPLTPSSAVVPTDIKPQPQVVPQGSARDLLTKPSGINWRQASIAKQSDLNEMPRRLPPSPEEVQRLQERLQELADIRKNRESAQRSPALTIAIPSGFGADNNTIFTAATYQNQARNSESSDGALGFGIGLGNAGESVGVEISYAIASFGNNARDFGSGGFNFKVHRRISEDFAIAAGVNGAINIGDENGFQSSFYSTATKIFRTQAAIDQPFSRVAVTAGLGNGQFRSLGALRAEDNDVNVFGNVAVRVAQPVSFIAEWSGQDLGVGLSIIPFKNLPLVITPAVRDIAGAGDGARFVLGGGLLYRF